MSIAAKKSLLKEAENRFGKVLTVEQMNHALSILADQLQEFDVEETGGDQSNTYNDLVSAFILAKQIEGKSNKTLERYNYIIKKMQEEIRVPIRKVNVYHLRQYLMDGRSKGWADRTIEGYRSVFCSFFNWLWKEGLIQDNPTANLAPIKCVKEVKLPYSDVDIEKLKESCRTVRDKAIVCFLLSTGCRISEVTQLNRQDVNLSRMECKVLGKGNKERIVYMDSVATMVLKRYLSKRTDHYNALFVGKGSSRMTPGGIRNMLVTLGQDSGVHNVHPHRFRRTLATNLINRGMAIQDVAHILGHDKLDTTMKYVYINDEDVRTKYRKYS